MSVRELGFEETPLGELMLRRRTEPRLGDREVFEVKLGDDYLMSSLFTESERWLATSGLAGLEGELDVVVGGLGLGYTAAEALKNNGVRSLLVIDLFQAVIDWHRQGLVPMSETLMSDERCELRQGNFFDLARTGFDVSEPGRRFDAVLLDIDHTPENILGPTSKHFYTAEGLGPVRDQLRRGGTFALWSDDPVDDDFKAHLAAVFGTANARNVEFPNPYTGSTSVNSVYVARRVE